MTESPSGKLFRSKRKAVVHFKELNSRSDPEPLSSGMPRPPEAEWNSRSDPEPQTSGMPRTPEAAWAQARKNLRNIARNFPTKVSGIWIRSLPTGSSVYGPGFDCFRYEWHAGKIRRFRTFTTADPETNETVYNIEWGPKVDAMDEVRKEKGK